MKSAAAIVSRVLFFFPPEAVFWTVHIAFTCGVPEANPVSALPTLVSVRVVVPTPPTVPDAATWGAFPAVATIISELDCRFPGRLLNTTAALVPVPDTVPSTSTLTLYSNGSAGEESSSDLTPSYGNLNTNPLLPESYLTPTTDKWPSKSWFVWVWNTLWTLENVWPLFIVISNRYKFQTVAVYSSSPLTLA